MRVIDAQSGQELKIGNVLPDGTGVLQRVYPGIWSAQATVWRFDGTITTVPLIVRWTHPLYFGRHVAFFPS